MAKREDLEVMIGRQVAETIGSQLGGDFTPRDVMSCYIMAVGATMAMIFEDATASKVKEACGEWGKRGFTEANSLSLR